MSYNPTPQKFAVATRNFGRSGTVPALMEMYGLTAKNIAAKAKEAISLK